MSRDDWYRNSDWNEEIEVAFFAKLKRARRKEQYLRIQASIIAKKIPDVALMLLEKYFDLNDDFDHAQAYCDMAVAFVAKGETDKAIDSYEKALKREEAFPNLLTQAFIHYPLMIVEKKQTDLFSSANQTLDKHKKRLTFPIDYFRWNAAKAIITAHHGDQGQASLYAEAALDAAEIKKSGFRFHQKVGLVGNEYKAMVSELRDIYA